MFGCYAWATEVKLDAMLSIHYALCDAVFMLRSGGSHVVDACAMDSPPINLDIWIAKSM